MILTPMTIADLPSPTPAATCASPNSEVSVLVDAQPTYPPSAPRIWAVVLVEVTVAPSGKLIDESIYQSSHDARIDMAALVGARNSTYAPKVVNCVPTTGSYIFRAAFDPQLPVAPTPSPSPQVFRSVFGSP